jgi:lysophospholipase L1-like esterase
MTTTIYDYGVIPKDYNNNPVDVVRAQTNADGSTSLVGSEGIIPTSKTTIGAKVLLLGDSMMQNNHQTMAPANPANLSFTASGGVATLTVTGGHYLISNQLITVSGFSGAAAILNANQAPVTWVSSTILTYPISSTATLGATLGSASASTNPVTILDWGHAQGFYGYTNGLLLGGLQLVNNAGVGGNTSANMLARLATDVDPYAFDQLWLNGGYNGINPGGGDLSAAAEWASQKTIIDTYADKGKLVVLWGTLPVASGYTGYPNTTMQNRILELRRLQMSYKRDNFIYVDWFLDAIDPLSTDQSAATGMLQDGIHPSAKLAKLGATRAYNLLNSHVPTVDLRAASATDNYAKNTASTQLIAVGWANTGGTLAGGLSGLGTAPAGFTVGATNSSGATVTAPARSDGFGYNALVTANAFSSTGSIYVDITIPTAGVAVGDDLVGVIEVVIDDSNGIVTGAYCQIKQSHATEGNGFVYSGNTATHALLGTTTGTFLLITPPMQVISGVTSLSFAALVYCSTGTLTSVAFGRPAVYKNAFESRA